MISPADIVAQARISDVVDRARSQHQAGYRANADMLVLRAVNLIKDYVEKDHGDKP